MAYQIRFSESAEGHFARLTAGQRLIVGNAVRTQLLHEPVKETRNRKPLRPNPLAPWELRVGSLRIFYEVAEEEAIVTILAIKRTNRLFIGGEEIPL